MKRYWKIQVNDWEKINKESAMFIINEADKFLKYTIEVSDKITTRAFSFLLITLTILIGIIGFTFQSYKECSALSPNLICNFLFAIMLIIVSVFLILIVSPRFFMMTGRSPKEIAINEFLCNDSLTPELSYLALILNEIENYQAKIEYNIDQNQKRTKRFKNILIAMIIASFVYLLIMVTIMF